MLTRDHIRGKFQEYDITNYLAAESYCWNDVIIRNLHLFLK